MSDDVYTVTITHEVSDRLIRDIIITGCEGGIGYWATLRDYNGPAIDNREVDGLPLYLKEAEHMDDPAYVGRWHTLGPAQIVQGIRTILTDYPNGVTARNLAIAFADGDASQLDATDCDNIIQCGVLGEIVYG